MAAAAMTITAVNLAHRRRIVSSHLPVESTAEPAVIL
jgi:hypothetical protein